MGYQAPAYFLPGGTLAMRGTVSNFAQGSVVCAGGSLTTTVGLATVTNVVVGALGTVPGGAGATWSGSVVTFYALLGTVPTAGTVGFVAFGV